MWFLNEFLGIRCLLCESDVNGRVAERCQEKAKQYDISVMAEKYLELYKKVYEENQKDN